MDRRSTKKNKRHKKFRECGEDKNEQTQKNISFYDCRNFQIIDNVEFSLTFVPYIRNIFRFLSEVYLIYIIIDFFTIRLDIRKASIVLSATFSEYDQFTLDFCKEKEKERGKENASEAMKKHVRITHTHQSSSVKAIAIY